MARKGSLQKHDCDRSGFTYRKDQLCRQKGLLVSPDEVDDLRKIQRPKPRWGSPRENSTTTTAVNSPTVFTFGLTGITSLSQSHEYREDGAHEHYFMHVIGSLAPTVITANPRIVAGNDGDRLTLYGTDDTNYIGIENGNGVSLIGGHTMNLKNKMTITFVYTSSDTTWREVSRNTDGF